MTFRGRVAKFLHRWKSLRVQAYWIADSSVKSPKYIIALEEQRKLE